MPLIGRTVRAGVIVILAASAAAAQDSSQSALVAFQSDADVAAFLRKAALVQQRLHPSWDASCAGKAIVAIDSTTSMAGPAVLSGRVHTLSAADSAGIAGASLQIGALGVGTISRDDGSFEIDVQPALLAEPKTVTVSARRIGYGQLSVPVVLRQGVRVHLDLSLCMSPVQLQEAVVTGVATTTGASVTNNQQDGVDEGDIVKRHGDHLVILRRGRLFTVDVRPGRLGATAMVDAFGPGIDPRYTWYDELLVAGDKVVVIGYSYERGGTELGLFHISRSGQLRYLDTYELRSNDYYSARNYASRLIGTRLVFYTPLYVRGDTANPLAALPAMRRWQPGIDSSGVGARGLKGFRPIVTARRIYRPAGDVDLTSLEALHTVTSCDLAAPELTCESTVVLGGAMRVFYVSPKAVYVAATAWRRKSRMAGDANHQRESRSSVLYRLPLDGGPPAALRIAGSPIDQFSFLEQDDHLNVLLRADGWGNGMWSAEWPGGALALLRLPLARFTDGTTAAPSSAYRALPAPDSTLSIHDRFVGDHLLYGAGNSWWRPVATEPTLFVVPVTGGEISRLPMSYGIDRIEALGRDAIVIGSDTANLSFTAVHLDRSPRLAQRYVLPQASQGELRSHGFFYRPDPGATGAGTLGLPVARPGRPGYEHLFEGSASVLFLRNEHGVFRPLGELAAHPERAVDDDCRASCVDWYGNARPLFVDGRIFALLGYEIVEGRVRTGRITEVDSASFAPRGHTGR